MALKKRRRLGMPEESDLCGLQRCLGNAFDRSWASSDVSKRLATVLLQERWRYIVPGLNNMEASVHGNFGEACWYVSGRHSISESEAARLARNWRVGLGQIAPLVVRNP